MPTPEATTTVPRPAPRALPVLLFGRDASWSTPLPADAGPLLVFTACDAGHLEHAVSLVRSVDVFSPGLVFVLHLVNPSRDELERVRVLAAGLAATRLAVSVEQVHLEGLEPSLQRSYAAEARFFRLAEIAHELRCPLLSLDADALVVSPIPVDTLPLADVAAIAGTHLLRPTEGTAAWLEGVARARVDAVTGNRAVATTPSSGVAALDRRFADAEFDTASFVWSGRGRRKHTDLRFFLLQRLLHDDAKERSIALRLAAEMPPSAFRDEPGFPARVQAVRSRLPAWVAVFVPRLDQPWGPASGLRVPPSLATEMLALRLHWKEFSSRLANSIERRGLRVELFEWPLRDIVPENVDAVGASLALIPHRCKLDYVEGRTPVTFYMQEYFRWVFVVDRDGWSAASSRYPVDTSEFASAPAGAYDDYRRRLDENRLSSKFGQPAKTTRQALEEAGEIPRGPYIFVPLQIPYDQSIRYFSPVGESELVAALVSWSRQRGVPLVMKPHPASRKAMAEFEALPRGELLFWTTASVQDLIEHAAAVYTINSGVGFEALLQNRPVVTFGRAEYDCVTVNAGLETLDDAWRRVQADRPGEREARYRSFVDWFLGAYAVDLSRETTVEPRLEALSCAIAARAHATASSMQQQPRP